MDLNQTSTDISLGDGQELIRLGDLDPIFKVTEGQRPLENILSALVHLKGWMDFNQTCTDICLRDAKELLLTVFVYLDHILNITGGQRMLKNALPAAYFLNG